MKYLLTFLLFFALAGDIHSQGLNIDSLQKILLGQKEDTGKVQTLLRLSDQYWGQNDFPAVDRYAKQALKLSQEIKYRTGELTARIKIAEAGLFQSEKGAYDLTNLMEALKIAQEINNQHEIANCYALIGIFYYRQEVYSESLKYALLELKIREKIGQKNTIAHTHQGIGATYDALGNHQQALEHYMAALLGSNEIRDTISIGVICYSIGDLYVRQGKYAEGLQMDSAALKLLLVHGNEDGVASSYEALGKYFDKMGDVNRKDNNVKAHEHYLEAIINFEKSMAIWTEQGRKVIIAELHIQIGSVQLKIREFDKARKHLEEGLQLSLAYGEKEILGLAYLGFSRLDSSLGNFKGAYENYKKYRIYQDSLNSSDDSRKAEGYRMQAEYEKNAAAEKTVQERKDAESKRTRDLQYLAIAAVIAVAIFFYWRYKQKQKTNAALQKAFADLKSTQAQLIQSEKMASLGELTAGIAHEIQNPLNFVNNFSEVSNELLDEMIEEVKKGNQEEAATIAGDVKQNLLKIHHHGKRADGIVKGMLQHSRSSSGQKEPSDVNALVDEYLRLAYHGLRAKDKTFNATLETKYDETLRPVTIVPQDIGRVFLNLISNAFYAVTEKGKQVPGFQPLVRITTKEVAGKVLVSVEDNGNGIPAHVIDKIFQPFFTTKPTGQGTGLGLSLSYDIVKAHGGELNVETREGQGTTFTLTLPVS